MTNGEEEENGGPRGRPNAYFAKIKQEEEEQLEQRETGDTFGGAFRGTKPAPHGGAAYVRPEQILGAEEYCWCGLLVGHDWPGKRVGAKHPKVGERKPVTTSTGTMPALNRNDLRAYHRRLQDFVMSCVGEGVRYRATKNSIILYPPDGSTPMTVHARNTDRQLRSLQKWYLEHVYVPDEVDKDAIEKLAQAKNDPVEHPAPTPRQEQVVTTPEPEPEPPSPEEGEEPVETVSTDGEWRLYTYTDGTTSERIETDGENFRCRECLGTDHELLSPNIRSVGGHNRMYHTDVSNMHSQEARDKALITKRANLMKNSQINQAIELLIEFAGYEVQAEDTHRVAELEAEVTRLTGIITEKDQALVEANKQIEETDAKLALLRETLGL